MGEGKQTVGLVEAWKVDDAGQPEYLDGIELQFAVQNASGCNVAFVFDGDAARRIALVPEMLDLIETIELAMKRGYDPKDVLDENSPIRDRIRAVIAATGVPHGS